MNTSQIEMIFKNALDTYNSENYDLAEANFLRILENEPNNAHAYYNLGSCYCKQHDYKKAITCYQRAISIDSNFSENANGANLCAMEIWEISKLVWNMP